MKFASDRPLALGSAEQEQFAEYRSVSKLSIVALIVGLLSAVALAHPLSWVIPIAGVLVALAAIRQTSRPDVALAGRWAAVLGLALSIILGVAAVSRWVTEKQIIQQQAQEFGDRWIELLRKGDFAFAVEQTQTFMYRRPAGMSLETYHEMQPEAKDTLKAFAEEPHVRRLADMGNEGTVEFVKMTEYIKTAYGRTCSLIYRVTDPSGEPFDLSLVVSRNANPEQSTATHWRIRSHSIISQ